MLALSFAAVGDSWPGKHAAPWGYSSYGLISSDGSWEVQVNDRLHFNDILIYHVCNCHLKFSFPIKGTVPQSIIYDFDWYSDLQSFEYITHRDVCLLSNIIEQDGPLQLTLKQPRRINIVALKIRG